MQHLPKVLIMVALAVSVACASQPTDAQPTPCAVIPKATEPMPYRSQFFYTNHFGSESKYIEHSERKLSLESWLKKEVSEGYLLHSIAPIGEPPNHVAQFQSFGSSNWILVTTEYDPIAASCHPAYSTPSP